MSHPVQKSVCSGPVYEQVIVEVVGTECCVKCGEP
jgi:hypothetical protein